MEPLRQNRANGGLISDSPAEYAAAYQPVVMLSADPSSTASFPPASFPSVYPVNQEQLSYDQLVALQQQQEQEQLQALWADQMAEIGQMTEFKMHSLALSRTKRIMKADEDVKMIAGEAPAIFAKACEMFIQDLTVRAWQHTEENKRRVLQKNDIAAAARRTDIFDFLMDVMPMDELKKDSTGSPAPSTQTMISPYAPEQQLQQQDSDDRQDE
ncbi:hypothetical protein GUJ93_ZPchr0008g12987 [Zizania palustris]|uniref:Core Histone H2A/H2B/H3 domain-containing protein n=1 Tax=Zizania palustris TaxID=103762 RepID=A0A8J5R5R1_ZIZPA|nr:hypothetical protein GUJ93_ZPchr0008g12987 [Zizania palustris]